jgi:hypothetical protein
LFQSSQRSQLVGLPICSCACKLSISISTVVLVLSTVNPDFVVAVEQLFHSRPIDSHIDRRPQALKAPPHMALSLTGSSKANIFSRTYWHYSALACEFRLDGGGDGVQVSPRFFRFSLHSSTSLIICFTDSNEHRGPRTAMMDGCWPLLT